MVLRRERCSANQLHGFLRYITAQSSTMTKLVIMIKAKKSVGSYDEYFQSVLPFPSSAMSCTNYLLIYVHDHFAREDPIVLEHKHIGALAADAPSGAVIADMDVFPWDRYPTFAEDRIFATLDECAAEGMDYNASKFNKA